MDRVLITGGTSGIGLAAAELFLNAGAKVALVGRNQQRGQRAVVELLQKCPAAQVCFIAGDVSNVAECQRVTEVMLRWAGGVDVLVNSAGIFWERAIEDVTEDAFIEMMDINVKGTYFMCKAVSQLMREQRSGSIVNVASDAGLHGNYLCTAYCASKGAVVAFTKALALEMGPYNVRVNAVCPGDILTPMTESQLKAFDDREEGIRELGSIYPLQRIGTDKEAAEVIVFLGSEKAGFVTGAAWTVDGGLTAR